MEGEQYTMRDLPSGQFAAVWYDPGGDIWADTFKKDGDKLYLYHEGVESSDEFWEEAHLDEYSQVWWDGNVEFIVRLDQVKCW